MLAAAPLRRRWYGPTSKRGRRTNTPRLRARRSLRRLQAEVLHRARVRHRRRAGGSDDPQGRAIRQRDRRRGAGVHGLHDDRPAASSGRDARRPRADRSAGDRSLRQAVRQRHRPRATCAARRDRVHDQRRPQLSARRSPSSAASATSPRPASGRPRWASPICSIRATSSSSEWNGCPDAALKKLGLLP